MFLALFLWYGGRLGLLWLLKEEEEKREAEENKGIKKVAASFLPRQSAAATQDGAVDPQRVRGLARAHRSRLILKFIDCAQLESTHPRSSSHPRTTLHQALFVIQRSSALQPNASVRHETQFLHLANSFLFLLLFAHVQRYYIRRGKFNSKPSMGIQCMYQLICGTRPSEDSITEGISSCSEEWKRPLLVAHTFFSCSTETH